MRNGRQRTVVVKGPCGTKSRALCARHILVLLPLIIFFSSDGTRFFRDSTRFICVRVQGLASIFTHPASVERVKFVITFITQESCIFQDRHDGGINR